MLSKDGRQEELMTKGPVRKLLQVWYQTWNQRGSISDGEKYQVTGHILKVKSVRFVNGGLERAEGKRN